MSINLRNYCCRKNLCIAAVFTAAAITVLLAAAYPGGIFVSAPEIILEDVEISKISLDETIFNVILIIDNKNIFGGTIKNLSFDILWENEGDKKIIAHGEKEHIKIDGNQKTRVQIPLLFYNKNIIPLASQSLTKGSLNMTVRGKADIELYIFKISVPFEETRLIDTNLINIISGIIKLIR